MKTLKYCCTLFFALAILTAKGQITAKKDKDKYPDADTTLNGLDPVKAEQAKKLVLDYIRIVLKGNDVDSMVSLCSVPFSWDRKKIIDNRADLKTMHQEIIDDKGKNRQYGIDTIFIRAINHKILDNIVPLNVYYVTVRIKVMQDGTERKAGILFAVQISDAPKIVGISD